jgi:hypothetical protein
LRNLIKYSLQVSTFRSFNKNIIARLGVFMMGMSWHVWPMRRIIPSAAQIAFIVLPMVGVLKRELFQNNLSHKKSASIRKFKFSFKP